MKSSDMMRLVSFVKHRDKRLLYMDFSGLDVGQGRELSEYAKGMIARMPKKSVLTLVNVKDVKFDDAFREVAGDLAGHNKPYVLAGAVCGVEGWRKLLYWATIKLTGRRNLKLFDDLEAAKEWLTGFREGDAG